MNLLLGSFLIVVAYAILETSALRKLTFMVLDHFRISTDRMTVFGVYCVILFACSALVMYRLSPINVVLGDGGRGTYRGMPQRPPPHPEYPSEPIQQFATTFIDDAFVKEPEEVALPETVLEPSALRPLQKNELRPTRKSSPATRLREAHAELLA